jgi:hypothetical protein
MNKVHTSFAVSTIAFGGRSKEEVAEAALQHGWAIEFSSGFAPDPDMIPFYKQASFPRYPHNYFPAPEDPFVMNLASTNEALRQRTLAHCLQGLELAKASGSPYFSAHAGFCIDPDPKQLGHPLDIDQPYDRAEHWSLFIKSLEAILPYAESLGITFLIENNVLAPFNYNPDRPLVLLCVDQHEMLRLIEEVSHPRLGLLLDTAHLKVSANTLGFDMHEAASAVAPHVHVVHHSDNDGLSDTNRPLPPDYWAAACGDLFLNRLHVLEVKKLETAEIISQLQFLQKIYHSE